MESRKNKVLRIVNTIYSINKNSYVELLLDGDIETIIYKCEVDNKQVCLRQVVSKCLYDNPNKSLDDLRDKLLEDFATGLIVNIELL